MKIIKNTLACLLILGIVFFGLGPFKTPQAQALSVSSYTADATGVTFTMNTRPNEITSLSGRYHQSAIYDRFFHSRQNFFDLLIKPGPHRVLAFPKFRGL